MDKKGITDHIDWIIGIGIFLVFLGLILTFFKPGVKDVFEPDTLLDILEENYLNDKDFTKSAMWQITKQPVFLEGVQVKDQGTGTFSFLIQGSETAYVTLKGDFVNGNIEEDFPLVSDDRNKNEVFFSASSNQNNQRYNDANDENRINRKEKHNGGNNGENGLHSRVNIDNLRSYSVPLSYDDGPKFCVNVDGDRKANFLVISSLEEINKGPYLDEDDSLGCNEVDSLDACESVEDQDQDNTGCAFSYTLGAQETLTGLNLDSTIENCGSNYNCIKDLWGFPDSKDFKIVVYDLGENNPDGTLTISGGEPPLEANVYTRTFNVQVLNHDAILVPATVSLQVW